MYNWQLPDWPVFKYSLEAVEEDLYAFAEETGHISGILKALPENTQWEAIVSTMVAEAIKTSAIEGEFLSRQDVISSIRNKLGLNASADKVKDKRSQGAGELMVDVRNTFAERLTDQHLFEWHRLLMKGSKGIKAGHWRRGRAPMQVISGRLGKERVHFEAPPSAKVPAEMSRFIAWFNESGPGGSYEIKKAPVRAAIAHLYFESIHPFEDGNGRIGRAIAEKALSQTVGRPVLLSLSRTIEAGKAAYYAALERSQKNNEITPWINYFVGAIIQAQKDAGERIDFTLKKAKFLDRYKEQLDDRRLKAVMKMLDAGPEGFKGGMTAQKYMSITKVAKATATRDLREMVEGTVLLVAGGGRSTHYVLNI